MEVTTESVVAPEVSTTAVAETSPDASGSPISGSSEPTATQGSISSANASGSQPSPYTPNYKVKVMDKELEMDDFIKGAIKDADTEKKARELYEKAYGIDEIKQAREAIRNEYKTYKEQWTPMQTKIQEATKSYEYAMQAEKMQDPSAYTYHFENVLNTLGIPEKAIQKFIFNKLRMEDASPEQKVEYNRRRELEYNNLAAQDRLAQIEQQNQQQLRQLIEFEYQTAVSKPDISAIEKDFNQRNGNDAFKRQIAQQGWFIQQTEGRRAQVDELVQKVINTFGLKATQQVQSSSPQSASQNVIPAQTPPVIPTVKGSAGSPAAKKIRDTDDMIKIRNQKYGY